MSTPPVNSIPLIVDLREGLPRTVFSFRGYNVTNLGRSPELLEHKVYGPVVSQYLREASEICADATNRRVNLVDRVRRKREPSLQTYGEAVALIVAMEIAQLRLLDEFFGVSYADSQMAFGYSLGEIGAVVASGVYEMQHALQVPLSLAKDCAEMASDITMGVLFSREPALDVDAVNWLCYRINAEGHGVISISSFLSPNTLLLLGQGQTVNRFGQLMYDLLPKQVHLRKNNNRWPPMHTSIVWERNIPSRAGVMMHTIPGGFKAPHPPIFSLVTGKMSYNDYNSRDILRRWVDHPQRLWDGIYETLASGAETVIHVGPDPNLVPATFHRLSDNVKAQLADRSIGGFGLRAVSSAVRRPWLGKLLPSRSALLRAPFLVHVILEDWLLAQQVK